MLTEEECLWLRMAIDRQLLTLNHALLWLQMETKNQKLYELLYQTTESLGALQPLLTPQPK